MKPFFGLNNGLAATLISFIIFGYAIYTLLTDGVVNLEQTRMIRLADSATKTVEHGERLVNVKYNFEETTTSFFGLYELEISLIKVSVSFLLFIVLLVGSSQRSKILLRIWMMVDGLIIILGFLSTLVSLGDSHIYYSGTPTITLAKFLITLGCCLWFFSVVLSLHEEVELEEEECNLIEDTKIRGCGYVAKKSHHREVEDKCPAYYDC